MQTNSYREKCKISRYGIINLFKECERLGYKLLRYPLGENADLGFALKKDEDTVVLINTSIRLSRALFTLVHEIGHVILHFTQSVGENLLKLYLNDVGLLTDDLYGNNIRTVLDDETGINLGSVYEIAVAQELARTGASCFITITATRERWIT